jgi:hypothetical protein
VAQRDDMLAQNQQLAEQTHVPAIGSHWPAIALTKDFGRSHTSKPHVRAKSSVLHRLEKPLDQLTAALAADSAPL